MIEFLSRFGNNAFTWDIILALIFVIIMSVFLYRNKKNVNLEKIIFPILYAFLYRGKFGIKWMKKFTKRHKELVKLFGYCSIGVGFIGMVLAVFLVFYVAFQLIFMPKSSSVAPFLPFTNVPVLGYISFSHWIITIFIIVLVHEGAHGLVSLAHGLKLKSTGFGIFAIFAPLLPAAFVEPDEEKIKKEKDVVQYSIFSAGPMANFVLMIPLLLVILLMINPVESNITMQDGFTFDVIKEEDYPAYSAGIENGQKFNTLNGKEVKTVDEFYRDIYWMKPGQEITLSYIDEKGVKEYSHELKLVENPDNKNKGFLGVKNLRDNVIIKDFAKPFSGVFSWIKGLFTLLLQITFSLGLINLFPASITDGGRMFSLALNKVSKNKKLNDKLVGAFALFFMIVILFALITFFTGNPFSLIFS
ncbi:MAG: site-2 protease family protein [Nanobdellota archaeon]